MKTRNKSGNTLDAGGRVSVLRPVLATNSPIPVRPEYIRLPRPGQNCVWTGLTRGKLNDLILPRQDSPVPPVKSFNATEPGKRRGTRLIVLQSLMDYLGKLRREQGAE